MLGRYYGVPETVNTERGKSERRVQRERATWQLQKPCRPKNCLTHGVLIASIVATSTLEHQNMNPALISVLLFLYL
jgi:hypothetical protein